MDTKKHTAENDVPVKTDEPLKMRETFTADLAQFPFPMPYASMPYTFSQKVVRSSPIPPPDELVRYPQEFQDQFLQTLKDRQSMAEKEQQHRHQCEKTQLEYDQKNVQKAFGILKLSAFLGFIILLIVIGAAIFCANAGHEGVAITFATTTIAAIIGAAVKIICGVKNGD